MQAVTTPKARIEKTLSFFFRFQATVNEMQMWLGGWLCLLMGRLVSEKLEHALKTAIDSFILSYCGDSKK